MAQNNNNIVIVQQRNFSKNCGILKIVERENKSRIIFRFCHSKTTSLYWPWKQLNYFTLH